MSKTTNYRIQNLRGIAFVLIFLSHCTLVSNSQGDNILKWFGAFGVEIFIVLSGFLAFKYYPNNLKMGKYYIKKVTRFLPLHWFTLVLSIPLSLSLPITVNTIGRLLLNISLLQVWIPKSSIYFSFNAVSWYLGITVFFVLLTPIIKIGLRNISLKKGIFSLFVTFFLEILIVIISEKIPLDSHWLTYICPLARSLDFLGGGVLYMISSRIKTNGNGKYILYIKFIGYLIAILTLLLSLFSNSKMYSTVIWYIPTMLIVYSVCIEESSNESIFSLLGDISFELFLFHQLIIRYIEIIYHKINLNNRIAVFLTALFISIVVSCFYRQLTIIFQKNIRGRKAL